MVPKNADAGRPGRWSDGRSGSPDRRRGDAVRQDRRPRRRRRRPVAGARPRGARRARLPPLLPAGRARSTTRSCWSSSCATSRSSSARAASPARCFTAKLPASDVDVYFVHCPALYHREGVYSGDWDEYLRFALLTRAALESCQRMGWAPDVVHVHDWHTALAPLYLRTALRLGPALRAHAHRAHAAQPRLPGRLRRPDRSDELGLGAARASPAPGGPRRRPGQLPQDRPALRRRPDHRLAHLRARDPDARARLRPRRAAARARRPPGRHRQRRRLRRVGPGRRPAPAAPVLGARPGRQGADEAGAAREDRARPTARRRR